MTIRYSKQNNKPIYDVSRAAAARAEKREEHSAQESDWWVHLAQKGDATAERYCRLVLGISVC